MRTHRDEKIDAPVVLVKWYDFVKWLLERNANNLHAANRNNNNPTNENNNIGFRVASS